MKNGQDSSYSKSAYFMRRLAILHFNPLELYPPVMNLLRFLARESCPELEIRVYTLRTEEDVPDFDAPGPAVLIIRKGMLKAVQNSFGRYGLYAHYYTSVTWDLFRWKPDAVMTYETLSFFPAYLYKRFFRRRSALMIHYHEYMSLHDYESGMFLNRWFHRLEKSLYPQTSWVSHTNEERMRRFLADNGDRQVPHPFILPNYPPCDWIRTEPGKIHRPVRIVYVGSLGMESMYLKEFAEWVIGQQGRVIWDIYALHVAADIEAYLLAVHPEWIRFKGACYYYDLPSLLPDYDIGVVLYRGIIPNHIYAVSNKVFEYTACGLDVWYAREMVGTHRYDTPPNVFPRIAAVDFSAPGGPDLEKMLDRTGLEFRSSSYFCEEALVPLIEKMRELN
jgi:hypothetical protein